MVASIDLSGWRDDSLAREIGCRADETVQIATRKYLVHGLSPKINRLERGYRDRVTRLYTNSFLLHTQLEFFARVEELTVSA